VRLFITEGIEEKDYFTEGMAIVARVVKHEANTPHGDGS